MTKEIIICNRDAIDRIKWCYCSFILLRTRITFISLFCSIKNSCVRLFTCMGAGIEILDSEIMHLWLGYTITYSCKLLYIYIMFLHLCILVPVLRFFFRISIMDKTISDIRSMCTLVPFGSCALAPSIKKKTGKYTWPNL